MTDRFEIRRQFAEFKASKLIEKYGICEPEHIRIKDIAYDLGATIIEAPLKNATASLVKVENYSTIRISPTDREERKRFSIAHEIGHIVLNHLHSVGHHACSDEDMQNWYDLNQEAEANLFAAELLMPKKIIEKRCQVERVDFRPIKTIAKEFRTSLTATAIRFVRFCPESCALIFSEKGKIKWCYKSASWWDYIQKGKALDKRSIAYDYFQGESIPEGPVEIEADAWTTSQDIDSIVEHTIGAPNYNFALTTLWLNR